MDNTLRTGFGLGACFVLFALFGTSQALAYTRTVSSQGKPLYWLGNDIPFSINQAVPTGLAAASVYEEIRLSFKTWSDQTCTCLRFKDEDVTPDNQLGYDQNNPKANKNLIIFQSSAWSHDARAVAITSNIFNEDTGEIVAYDMEINDVHFLFSLDGLPRNGKATMDLRNVVTHEVGHVIGLDHSSDRQSTMYASGLPGETKKRNLHADDISGLCTLYPQNACLGTKPNSMEPGNGCGCHHSPTDSPALVSFVLFAMLGLLFLVTRQRSS